MNLLMIILNYGGHVRPLYTGSVSAKGALVQLEGAPPGCLCHTLTHNDPVLYNHGHHDPNPLAPIQPPQLHAGLIVFTLVYGFASGDVISPCVAKAGS
jgi:hypothetical protein